MGERAPHIYRNVLDFLLRIYIGTGTFSMLFYTFGLNSSWFWWMMVFGSVCILFNCALYNRSRRDQFVALLSKCANIAIKGLTIALKYKPYTLLTSTTRASRASGWCIWHMMHIARKNIQTGSFPTKQSRQKAMTTRLELFIIQ